MTEFVSGLPGRDPPPAIDPRGIALLDRIRAHAKAESETLKPLTERRFDGEWLEPDSDDIAMKEDCDLIVRLVDEIKADPLLCKPLAAKLAGRGGR